MSMSMGMVSSSSLNSLGASATDQGPGSTSGSNPFSSSYKSGPSSGPPSAGSAASMAGDRKSLYDISSFLVV